MSKNNYYPYKYIDLQDQIVHLLRYGMMRQCEIMEFLDVPRTTIHDKLRKMQKYGYVKKVRQKIPGKPGRPYIFWKLRDVK